MKIILRAIIFLALAISFQANADTLAGKVIGVSDGDTVTLLSQDKQQIKVRLAAIDAPEKAQAFGQRAKQHVSDLCFGKQAEVKVIDTDRYGRSVGEVSCDGVFANAEMIKAGMAWVYRKYSKGYVAFFPLEEEARVARRGLWSDTDPVAPWEWRKSLLFATVCKVSQYFVSQLP